jgi:predicted AAA+ superfamily ATPase
MGEDSFRQKNSHISYNELSQLIGSDPKTVSKYIDILEKAFIVFRLGSYSRNLRNELKKSRKVYFYDLGIRNYVLGDWRPLNLRGGDETGHIWENYVISESGMQKCSSKRLCTILDVILTRYLIPMGIMRRWRSSWSL